jgi:quinol monooxygenase YgiN
MVIEQGELDIVEGCEDECVRFLAASRGVFENFKGCRSLKFGRSVEEPSKVMMNIAWDSVEVHEAATRTPEFAQFFEAMRGFMTGVKVGHFAVFEG